MDVHSVEHKLGRLPWWVAPLALVVVVVLVGMSFAYGRLLVAGSSTNGGGASSPSGVGTSQAVEGNGVTVTLTWQGQPAGPVFSVGMDTHSGSLDGYNLAQLAVMRTSSGQEVAPVSWAAPSGGHHRKGTLTFPSTGPDGKPLMEAGSGPVTVIIKGVAGVGERSFTWTP
jgi:hypothetical protein